MRDEREALLTLEERLARSAKSQAASPEVAVKLVKRFAGIPVFRVFFGKPDLEAMYELTGEFWEHPSVSVDSYQGFSHSYRLAAGQGNHFFQIYSPDRIPAGECDSYEPVWGVRMNNAMVLLGLMLLDHARGRLVPRDIYHCMRMTLGQYLDAVTDLGFRKNGGLESGLQERVRAWRDVFLKGHDGSKPLGDALADILGRYIAAWQEFDHLDHILRCIGALSCYLEQEEVGRTLPQKDADRVRHFREALCRYGSDLEGWELVEIDKRYLDPEGYYFTLACEYPEELPDPGSRDAAPGALRSRIFLSERDYHPGALRELAVKSPSQDLRALLEKYVCEGRLAVAMREINMAVTDLYMLWVEPYLRMGK